MDRDSRQAMAKQLLKELHDQPLSKRSVEQLVEAIKSPDAWVQRLAARLIIERDQVEAIPELTKLVDKGTTASVESQVIAWNLLGLIDPAARTKLQAHLTDYHRLIQVTALRMIPRLPALNDSSVEEDRNTTRTALELAMDSADPWLRLEATMSAARAMDALTVEDAQAAAAGLGKLAAHNSDDAHLLVAAAGAARRHPSEFLCHWLDGLGQLKEGQGTVGEDLNRQRWILAATRQLTAYAEKTQPENQHEVVARIRYLLTTEDSVSPLARLAALTALGQTTRTQIAAAQKAKVKDVAAQNSSADQPIDALSVVDRPLWRKVREMARLDSTTAPVRLAAVELLALSQRKPDRKVLAALSNQTTDNRLRNVAIKSWCEQGTSEAEEF